MTDDVVPPDGELIEGPGLRGWLDAAFARAEALDLEPEWEDDRLGFSCICQHCRAAGEPDHRGSIRPQPLAIIPVGVGFMQLPMRPADSATGPAS